MTYPIHWPSRPLADLAAAIHRIAVESGECYVYMHADRMLMLGHPAGEHGAHDDLVAVVGPRESTASVLRKITEGASASLDDRK